MKAEFKRKLIATLVVPAIGLSVAGTSIAASDRSDTRGQSADMQRQGTDQGGSASRASTKDMRASNLIGMTVKNAQGETLGKIDDLIVDVNNERIYYAVLASGGVMGMGGKNFAYPVSIFRAGADKDTLALNVDKERLERAPGFDKDKSPNWGDEKNAYRAEVDRYFGPTVAAKPMPNQRLVRASTLMDKDVNDRQGADVGKIKDMVVSLGTGQVRYIVLDVDSKWTRADKLIPVSLKAFTFTPDQDKEPVLNVAKNKIDPAKGIEKDRWADLDLNDPAYKRRIDSQVTAMSASASRAGAAGEAGERRTQQEGSRRDKVDDDIGAGR